MLLLPGQGTGECEDVRKQIPERNETLFSSAYDYHTNRLLLNLNHDDKESFRLHKRTARAGRAEDMQAAFAGLSTFSQLHMQKPQSDNTLAL